MVNQSTPNPVVVSTTPRDYSKEAVVVLRLMTTDGWIRGASGHQAYSYNAFKAPHRIIFLEQLNIVIQDEVEKCWMTDEAPGH